MRLEPLRSRSARIGACDNERYEILRDTDVKIETTVEFTKELGAHYLLIVSRTNMAKVSDETLQCISHAYGGGFTETTSGDDNHCRYLYKVCEEPKKKITVEIKVDGYTKNSFVQAPEESDQEFRNRAMGVLQLYQEQASR